MKKKAIILALVLIILVIFLTACASTEKKIVGTWRSQTTVLGIVTETKYEFKEDGTGSKTTVLEIPFTYSIEGDIITITTTVLELELDEEFTFEINGDTLVLDGILGTTEYERVK